MLDQSQILSFLQEKGIPVEGSIVKDSGAGDQFFVFVAVTRDADNRQVPSNRKLDGARDALAEMGAAIEFLLTDPQTRDIEGGLRATLLHAFGSDIRNAFMSLDNAVAHVWLDPKRALDDSIRAAIERKVNVFLQELGISLGSMAVTTGENLPSMLACLKVIRQMAPVEEPALRDELTGRGFKIPSPDWLTRRLDAMRRAGKIARLDDGRYALCLKSLRELGTIKGRASPDISRLLALARTRL